MVYSITKTYSPIYLQTKPTKTLKLQDKCKPYFFIKQIFVYVLKHKIIYIFVLNLHHITDDK